MTAALAENTFTGLGDNIFVHHNSIASNTGLKSGASWQFSGTGFRLSSRALTKVVNGGWSTVSTYAGGSCSSTATNRTGDYSGAQLDPSDLTSFWLAGERNIVLGGSCQWETRVAKLVP